YSLQAVLAGVRHGERELPHPDLRQRRQRLAELASRAESLTRELTELRPPPFTGRTLFIDDEDPQRVTLLVEKRGHGINPPGEERGQRDDRGGFGRLPNLSGGRYTWWENRERRDVLAYHPGVEGRFRIWLSWG